ncbi:MAG: ABC transporter substrate-binding protein, partial [Christensenellales bacterium]
MRTIKKLIVILLCLSLFTFVACGSDNDDVGGGENIKLKVWVQTANQPQFFTWAAKRYKELTNGRVTVNWTAMPSATLGSGLDAALGGNEAPDIAATWGGLIVPQLIKGNRIINIDDVIDEIGEENLNSSALINEKDSEGKGWYSLPFSGFASPVVFYNKTFFDANGMQVPSTYDELVALCNRISGLGKEGISSGFGDWQMSHFMQAMHSRTLTVEGLNGLIGVNYEKNPFASASDPAKPLEGIEEGFSLLKSYCDDGIFVNNITGYNVSQAQSYFKNGLALMYAAPSSEYLELSSATFEIG